MKVKRLFFIILLLSGVLILAGYAVPAVANAEAMTGQTSIENPADYGNQGNFVAGETTYESGNRQPVIVNKTEVKETKVVVGHGGIFSSTVHLIGEVLAFPFKIIAGAIEIIF